MLTCRLHRTSLKPRPLALAIALIVSPLTYAADAPDAPLPAAAPADTAVMPSITITGKTAEPDYTVTTSKSASKLDLSLRETPQSVSVVTRAMMDDFKLDNVNDLLANTAGVTVERVETDRTYYPARGFDIINFQYDGVGIPAVFGNVTGDMDTVLYERVDVVRGANGLSSATGNPSATVNFIRKRPTAQVQANASVSLGSWDTRRVTGDVSTPLNASSTVAARVVLAHEKGDSYLDRNQKEKNIAYGVVEAHLSDATTLTLGHSLQNNHSSGAMWGALPLYYTDGSLTNYDVGASTSTDWSRVNSRTQSSFAELAHSFGNGWTGKATLTRTKADIASTLFYVYGTPERSTGKGLFAYPSIYNSSNRKTVFDAYLSGKFNLGGRQHDLSAGVATSRSTINDLSLYGRGIGTALSEQTVLSGSFPLPLFDAATDGSQFVDKRTSVYAATRINLSDKVKLLAGLNNTDATSSGMAYGVSSDRAARSTTPYAGLVIDLNEQLSGYASYTEIFKPQSELDINHQPLAAVKGSNTEVGLKGEFFDGLNASAAVFRSRQSNASEQAGTIGATAYYRGVDARSTGVEFELAGEISKGWNASANYTQLAIHDQDGAAARTFIPR